MSERIRCVELSPPTEIAPSVEAFLRALGGPTLLRVRGSDPSRTRAVSTLLHGNEPSGVRAVYAWLRSGGVPAVNAVILLGAVEAALAPPGFAHRALAGHADLNRCFRPPFAGEAGAIAAESLRRLRAAHPEFLIDLHNNTGHSPPYGVGSRMGNEQLNLTRLFGERFVHSRLRLGALVEATEDDFPSVTIECGCAGDPAADAVALAGLERYLAAEQLGEARAPSRPVSILVDPIRVRVRPDLGVAFGEGPVAAADFTVASGVDRHNFERLAPGVTIGWIRASAPWPVEAVGADGREVSRDYFAVRDGVLETRRELIPIMMTTDPQAALGDCLCYLVQPRAAPRRP